MKKLENPENEVRSLPILKRGRKVMLGEQLDDKVKKIHCGIAKCWTTPLAIFRLGEWFVCPILTNAIIGFAMYLENPRSQLFNHAINTQSMVILKTLFLI